MKKVILLLLLATTAWLIYDYRFGTPGESAYERVFAKKVIMDFETLEPTNTAESIMRQFHYLNFTCLNENSQFGDHVCWSPIKSFNGIDARVLAFFFSHGKLSAVRVSFLGKNHPELFAQLSKKYGEFRIFGKNRDVYGNNIVGWIRPNGIISVNDKLDPKVEAILLWTSGARIVDQIGK